MGLKNIMVFPSLIINRLLGSAFRITDVTDPIIKFIEHPSKDEIDRKFGMTICTKLFLNLSKSRRLMISQR